MMPTSFDLRVRGYGPIFYLAPRAAGLFHCGVGVYYGYYRGFGWGSAGGFWWDRRWPGE